jgi:hypothetical protein
MRYEEGEVRAVSAKGGLMMGTKKVGTLSSPLEKVTVIIASLLSK